MKLLFQGILWRNKAGSKRQGARPARHFRRYRPALELLEERRLLSFFQLRFEQDGYAPLTITDGGPGDSLPDDEGSILFMGSYGTFSINVTGVDSKPQIGGTDTGHIDFETLNISSSVGGTLTITAADTDFASPPVG